MFRAQFSALLWSLLVRSAFRQQSCSQGTDIALLDTVQRLNRILRSLFLCRFLGQIPGEEADGSGRNLLSTMFPLAASPLS